MYHTLGGTIHDQSCVTVPHLQYWSACATCLPTEPCQPFGSYVTFLFHMSHLFIGGVELGSLEHT